MNRNNRKRRDSSTETCTCIGASDRGYPIERKAINTSGHLGSLYDASTDNLVDSYSIKNFERKRLRTPIICRVTAGNQERNLAKYLRIATNCDESVLQSISLQMLTPTGICRFMEYDQLINERTRFIYYAYKPRQDKLRVKARKAHKIAGIPDTPTEATHMITKIIWGIEILCVIQIPDNHSIPVVDQLLQIVCRQLNNNQFPIQMTNRQRKILQELTNVKIYGCETCVNQPNMSVSEFLSRIEYWKRNVDLHQPLTYTMQPLRWLYNIPALSEPCGQPNPNNEHISQCERTLKRITRQINVISDAFLELPTSFLSVALNDHLKSIKRHYIFLLDSQDNIQERIRRGVVEVRRHRSKSSGLINILKDQRYASLSDAELKNFEAQIVRLTNKSKLIHNLDKDQIEYMNVCDINTNKNKPTTVGDIDVILKRTYNDARTSTILWYSSDRLKRVESDKWRQIYEHLTLERRHSQPRIKLIYVDFTYFEYRLNDFIIVRKPLGGAPTNEPVIPSEPPPLPPPRPSDQSHSSSQVPTEMNVLLLGETGVGKSTFINAFVNYLKFENLREAERGDPAVLIPVSFLITIGNSFEEFIVNFGKADPNENYEHQGHSVTQHCRSYVFPLNNKVRLRIIDTPGIGDTRGIKQDVENINHILTYINNLSHLNAICLLLKPNASRLNIFFRSCVHQLLTYVTPIGYKNIIFCFTNSRTTFYAPGDTAPLLRKMLNDEHLQDIPFQKENTFCFDNESFRYLAARKCGVNFDDYEEEEYANSWVVSVKESRRLLNFVLNSKAYNLQQWLSPRKAEIDIGLLARPLMETIRLTIYNWQLNETKSSNSHVVLNAAPVNIETCTYCAQINMKKLENLWIVQYLPPNSKDKRNQHSQCPTNGRNFDIDTIVTHSLDLRPAGIRIDRWRSSFHNLLLKCDRLHHFLRQQGPTSEDDPFLPILERFLDEEEDICQIHNVKAAFNQRIRETLNSVKRIRHENSQKLFGSNEQLSLNQIYQIINELLQIDTIRKQVESIKESRHLKMKAFECIIPMDSLKAIKLT